MSNKFVPLQGKIKNMAAIATKTATKGRTSPTMEVLHKIYRLPISDRMYIVERTIHSVRSEDAAHSLENAVDLMADEYRTNRELTEFTQLDDAAFYETR